MQTCFRAFNASDTLQVSLWLGTKQGAENDERFCSYRRRSDDCSSFRSRRERTVEEIRLVGWDIFVNDSMGPGCLIARKLSPDVQLRMGIDATRKIGYMALYAKADANVSAG